ncbi:restriction endonuclease subunit S [Shewanella sp. SM55]|uniref:restriction endonuclease subunit S n=1 Tax=Shewanella sp. SM55 TaxID=2912800 RepID=UPI0021D887F6|nr:restriction endonuclease subunit S [Shewanella sp. SM55]MCU8060999.1 restriction endonuclease subunit S [Shewanella sp. SM55]
MSELPKGWVKCNIDSLCTKPEQFKPSDTLTFKYIDISSVDRESKTITSPSEILGCDAPSRARKLVNTGDIIVSMTRPNLNAVAKIPPELDGNIASTGFDVLKPILIEPDWLFSIVKSKSFIAAVSGTTIGALYPACKASDIRNYELPLPPLAEQKRIVAKLDEVLAQVDTIKARLDRIPTILKRFRQSVLAAAVSGKLTEEWRAGRNIPVKDSFAQVADFRGKNLKSLPNGWIWVRFDAVNEVASNLVDPLDNPKDFHIAPNHIESKSGRLFEYTTVEEDKVKSAKHRFFAGQVLYSKIRPYLCKAVIVDFSGVCSADMYPLNTQMEPRFLLNWLLSDQFTEWASNGDSRTVLPKINKKQLSEIPCPLPSPEEQKEIVRLVDHYFVFADSIEAQVKKAQARVDNLTQSILAKAFRGELVAQDPNDEPADKLLERIAQARTEAEALAKTAKKLKQ